MMMGGFVVLFERWLIYFDTLSFDDSLDLGRTISVFVSALIKKNRAYPLLEASQIRWAKSVCFGDYWNEVHSGAQPLHDLDIQRLECVARRANKVETGVDSQVNFVAPAWLLLLEHVRLMLVI